MVAVRQLNPLLTRLPMLHSLLPKSYNKFLSMPLLGAIVDGFDDWLAASGYTRKSRKLSIWMLAFVDANLRRRHVKEVTELTHQILHDCWRGFVKTNPSHAGTVRTLERYLVSRSLVADRRKAVATATSRTVILCEEYADHLRQVRGFAASTVSYHLQTAQCFLKHIKEQKTALQAIQSSNIESYIAKIAKRMSRASLKCVIGRLRGFLRFLAMDGRVSGSLDRQIDTPRTYRLEQLPRALPWGTVRILLRSIDRTSATGLRNYAMFLLMATYGLRASEVVSIALEDIRWRKGSLLIHQRKTSSPLELPLTNEVAVAIVKHLKRTPPQAAQRKVFLRRRAPIGALQPTAINRAFWCLLRKSGLDIPFQGPHCLRHSLAVHLLKNGTPLKTIGDILGHRSAESTLVYLRLATEDLREVALKVPANNKGTKAVQQ